MNKVPTEAIWRQIFALFPVYMMVFVMGCSDGWLPNAIYFLTTDKKEHATTSQCSLISLSSELGRIIFAIPAGILVDKYGRRNTSLSIALLFFFAWIGLSLSTSVITIYAGRFVIGLAESMVYATSLIAIGETASPEIRGQLLNIGLICINIGLIFPSIISVTLDSYKSLAWTITPFTFVSLLSMYWMAETPSYLISRSNHNQAKIALRRIRKGYGDRDINDEFEKLSKYIEDEKTQQNQLTWLEFLKMKSIRKPLLTGILLNVFTILIGSVLIKTYITVIIPQNEFVPKKYYPLVIQVCLLFIAFITTFYIDKFNRRAIFLLGAATMSILNGICAVANYYIVEGTRITDVFKWIFIFANLLGVVCYGATIQPMNSAMKAELYPQAMKGFCGSFGIISQALAFIIALQLYDFVRDYSHLYLMYMIFSVNSLVLCLVIYFLLSEGRGESLTDFQLKFHQKVVPHVRVEKMESN